MIDRSRKTFRLELVREFFLGILENGLYVFGMLVAIRFLHAGEFFKAMLACSSSVGLIFMPWVIQLVAWTRLPVSRFAGCVMLLACLLLSLVPYFSGIKTYFILMSAGGMCLSIIPGLMVEVYAQNYNPNERGQRLAWALMVCTFSGMVSSYAFGYFLDRTGSDYSWLFVVITVAGLASTLALFRIPSEPLDPPAEKEGLLGSMSLIVKDRLFGWLLLAWMTMGIGMIMTFPLRIEYLAGESDLSGDGGLGMTNEQVALVTVFAFSLARILSSILWGRLFDRLPFIPFRVMLNLFLIFATLIYFHSDGFAGVCIGAALAGIGLGGATIAWNLWVTKLAPVGQETRYMSVHVSLTGFRGILAPFLGYWILSWVGFQAMAWISAGLVFLSILIFSSVWRHERLQNG